MSSLTDFKKPVDPDSARSARVTVGGRYQLIGVISETGGERVELARDLKLDREVAIVTVTVPRLGEDGCSYVASRARMAARLGGHPYAAEVYDTGEEEGQPYFVREHPGGGTLADLIRRAPGRHLALGEALRIAIEICEALRHAHSLGVVHGGLTPGVILLGTTGSAKLSDFGFGLSFASELSRIVGASMPLGDVGYAAPEQVLGGPPEARSDLYALGAIVYEMVSGRPPFVGREPAEILAKHLQAPPAPLSSLVEAPPALTALLECLLRKEPGKRPADAGAVLNELTAIAGKAPRGARAPVAIAMPADMPRVASQAPAADEAPGTVADGSVAAWLRAQAGPFAIALGITATVAVLSAGSALMVQQRVGDQLATLEHRWSSALPLQVNRRAESARAPVKSAATPASHPGVAKSEPAKQEELSAEEKPFRDLVELASAGNSAAETTLGNIFLRGDSAPKDYSEALQWFLMGAARGDARAQLGLGYVYFEGDGVDQDYGQAVRWFRASAEQGDPDAQYDLATMYDAGRGVSVDRATALRWLRRAAAHGQTLAQYQLGDRYMRGDGVEQNYDQALRWLRQAAAQGSVPAENALGFMYEQGNGVDQSYAQALGWYRKAAGQRDARAELNLGLMYEKGEGVAQDYAQAASWYRKAADDGDGYAATSLGVMYCKGEGMARDYAKARDWFLRAAEHGEPKAEYDLAVMYDSGMGVPKNEVEAARWYRRAAEQGLADAQYDLGNLYENGQGVTRDYAQAREWYRKAATQGDDAALQRLRQLDAKSKLLVTP